MMNLALEDPHLDPDDPIGGTGFGKAVVDIRSQGVQRNTAFALPFGAGNFSSAQTAGTGNLDSLATELRSNSNGPFHGPAECDTTFELAGDILCNKLGIGFGATNFVHLDREVRLEPVLEFGTKFFDFNALASDDNARTSGEKNQANLVCSPFDLNLGDAGMIQLFLDELSELVVFENKLWIILLTLPPGQPVFVIP